jgi:hypothetical protein
VTAARCLAVATAAAALTLASAELAITDARAGGDCAPDVKPSIAAPLRTVRRPFEHRARGRLAVRVDNPSTCAATERVGIKPLLLPTLDVITHGEHTHPAGDGRVLPTTYVDLDVPAGASRTYLVTGRLPPLEWQTYRLAAIFDSGQTLGETNELDGVTALVSAGYVGISRGNPPEPAGAIDFTTTIRGQIDKQDGGVQDTLGLHSRPGPPPFALDSHDVGVRFLLADISTGAVYTLIYRYRKPCAPDCGEGFTCNVSLGACVDASGNPVPEIDKEYYAIAWGNNTDELGRPVVTDIYWQAPHYVDDAGVPFVPPGTYRFITVADSWDRVPEFDETNNIDATPFTLAPLEVVGHPNTWFVSTAADPVPPDVNVRILNSYSADLDYTVTVSSGDTWLAVTPPAGSLQIDDWADLTFTVDRGALATGAYEAEVTITAAGFEAYPLVVPVSFHVYNSIAPAMDLSPTTLDFQTPIGVHPPPQGVMLENTGTGPLPLAWEAYPNVGWISVAPPDGAGPPGYTEGVSLIIHPEGMAPGGPYIGTVSVLSNAPGGAQTLTARLSISPCESGFCTDGWECNFATHYCEPPLSCVDHDECPTGQHCPPELGYCEASGLCTTDADCEFVWSPYGALECDVTRGTCELAICASDVDCPIGSYCEEPIARCDEAGTCVDDSDCFGFPFAFECDTSRSSCRPAECVTDTDCPAASYCSTFWDLCVDTAHCDEDLDCYSMGMQCDEARDACVP